MGKRGRPSKKQPCPVLNTDDKPSTSSSPRKRGRPPKQNPTKKKINLSSCKKKSDSSGDSDATEVYVKTIIVRLFKKSIQFFRYSMSDKDEDFIEKPKTTTTKRKRKVPVTSIRVNHNLSDNSDDDLSYSRRSIIMKNKRRPSTSSSSSILSADDDDDEQEKNCKYPRPPIPTFKRKQDKNKKTKKNLDAPSDDEEIILTDEDYHTDVEKMDDHALIEKTERRMLTDKDLTQMTQQALDDEKQRVQRIQQRQSQIPVAEIVLDDLPKKKESEHEVQLVFEYESNTNKPLISVDTELVAKMKPHQIDGTLFLWENVYESIEQIKKDHPGTGCILAHHMGLYVYRSCLKKITTHFSL